MTYEHNLPFAEWRSEVQCLTVEEACAALDIDPGYFPEQTVALWVYPNGTYIEEMESGRFYVLIGRSDYYSDRLSDLEPYLHDHWDRRTLP